MKILAAVQMEDNKVQSFWDMTDGDPCLIISKKENGDLIAIPLDPKNMHRMDGYLMADYAYLGELNISQAVLIPTASNSN